MKLYKLNPYSVQSICSTIQRDALKLRSSMELLESVYKEASYLFVKLRKELPEPEKLHVMKEKTEKGKHVLSDLFKQDRVSNINREFSEIASHLFSEIHTSITLLEKIILDSNALLYKKEKSLNRAIALIENTQTDAQLIRTLVNRIYSVKEDMKTVARRLYEASRAQERNILTPQLSQKARKIPLSEQIKELCIDIRAVDKLLSKLNLIDIDDFAEDIEKEITDIKKIALDSEILLSRISRYLDSFAENLHLLDEKLAESTKNELNKAARSLNKAKSKITEQAALLLQEIKITE